MREEEEDEAEAGLLSRAREHLEKHEGGGVLAPDAACHEQGGRTCGENQSTRGAQVGARFGRGAREC